MDLTLKTAYWDDAKARRAFQSFILEIHGLDFSEWEAAGYWDEDYTPFTFFEGDRVVASVCIYSLAAILHGRAARVAQISGVGTLPEWRRRGLNRQLTEIGLDWAGPGHAGVFLFSDTDAIPYYERCGYRPLVEYVERAPAPPTRRRAGAVHLDPSKRRDRDRIYGLAKRRAPVSSRFSVLSERLLMFHALRSLRDHGYEIPDLGCIVFFRRAEGVLRLFDIVGERIPTLEELYPYISDENDELVELHFHADKLGLSETHLEPLTGNNCFVRGSFPVERPVFPFTSRA